MTQIDPGITEALDSQFRHITNLNGIMERVYTANAGMVEPDDFLGAMAGSEWFLPRKREWVTLREILRRKRRAFRHGHNLTPTHVLIPQEFTAIASRYGVDASKLRLYGMEVLYGLPWFECLWLPSAENGGRIRC